MTDQERSEAIKRQVEYYFSRQNLLQVFSNQVTPLHRHAGIVI